MKKRQLFRQQLRTMIDEYFVREEVRTLCFDLDVRYDQLPGEGKGTGVKVRELVQYMELNGRLQELVHLCQERRPRLDWPEVPSTYENTAIPDAEPSSEQTTEKLQPQESGRDLLAGAAFWTQTYGEPAWVEIPAGEFWMGSDSGRDNERPEHRINLPDFKIARTPVTNAQYHIFVKEINYPPPIHWQSGGNPPGFADHPVVYISAYDAEVYCAWLSEATRKKITLPTEAEWEKAARGNRDKRAFPWGDAYDPTFSNTQDNNVDGTTPAGSYPQGASPFGVLDMCGNTWEWAGSLYKSYPYNPQDGREDLGDSPRILRGGAYYSSQNRARCSYRSWDYPHARKMDYGFRVTTRY